VQDLLAGFCYEFINESAAAMKILKNCVVRKNRYRLQMLENQARGVQPMLPYVMTENDKEAIYDLLSENSPHYVDHANSNEDDNGEDI
jgi:hypothetical protein